MAFRIRPAVKEALRLTDEQCRYIARRGGTSLRVSVGVNVNGPIVVEMGYSVATGERTVVSLARFLDPEGRCGNGCYDHKDRNQLNYAPGNTHRVTPRENALNTSREDVFLVFEV